MSKLYPKVEAELLSRIKAQVWSVGDKLPTERMLAEEFGVSRSTMRHAMLTLEDRGMVSRSPRRGTILISDTPRQIYKQHIGALEQLDDYAAATHLKIQMIDVVAVKNIDHPKVAEWHWPEEMVRYRGWRSFEGQSERVSLTEVCYDIAFDGIRDRIGKERTPTHRMIAQTYGIKVHIIEQEVRATALGQDAAKILLREPSEASLQISRVMLTHDAHVIMTTRSLHCSDAVTLSMQIKG